MTITQNKKKITITIVAIVIVIFSLFAYQRLQTLQYESAAKEMRINTCINVALLEEVLSDINNAWNKGIEGGAITNAEGETVYVHDMSEAVQIRLAYWKAHGYYDIIDSLSEETSLEMETMSNTPSKYEYVQKNFAEIYNNTNELISLSKTPQYSLIAFSQKVNDLLLNGNTKIKETDLSIKISDDEIQKRSLAIYCDIINKGKQIRELKEKKEKAKLASHIKKQKVFLAQNAKKPGVITLPCGLQYKIIKKGLGVIPKAKSIVICNYSGQTVDGEVFDSSYKRGIPITLRPDQVMRGWTEALTRMPEGSVWEIYMPEYLAYGNKAQGLIKPYSTLIFKIELIKVK